MHPIRANEERIREYRASGSWHDETLSTAFEQALAARPDEIALIDPPNKSALVGSAPLKLTFRQLDEAARKLSAMLHGLGLRQHDRIVVQMPNTVEIVYTYLAAARLGLIISPVAMQYRSSELSHIVETIEPRAYLACASFNGADYAADVADVFNDECVQIRFGQKTADDKTDHIEWFDEANPEPMETWPSISADHIFTVCWTSGTTGRSKGVPRTHNHWNAIALTNTEAIDIAAGEALLNPFPLINMAAIGGFLYVWLKRQARLVLHHPFEPGIFLSQLQDERVSYTIAPPAVLNMLLAQRDTLLTKFDLSNLRIIGSGSAPLAPEMIEGYKALLNIDIINFFGSNEGMAIIGAPDDVASSTDRARYFPRFGASGFTWTNQGGNQFKSKLISLETGTEITEPGITGELHISGPTVFDGYYRSPEDNALAFAKDGHFRTGDLFQIAGPENRFYQFVGRCKDLIVRGGMNISPEELDIVIASHPDIIEAAVCAYPDDVMGEKVCAVVVLGPDKSLSVADLSAFLEQCGIAKFKWPERLVKVDALPRNPLNKVPRAELSQFL
ncbi:MAG: class I adenylate-forming enzyme family protein [Henriciella sp.]